MQRKNRWHSQKETIAIADHFSKHSQLRQMPSEMYSAKSARLTALSLCKNTQAILIKYILTETSGALKGNIGHLEGTSGIAGVIKAILVLEKAIIPPNANLENVNVKIDEEYLKIKVKTKFYFIIVLLTNVYGKSFLAKPRPGRLLGCVGRPLIPLDLEARTAMSCSTTRSIFWPITDFLRITTR